MSDLKPVAWMHIMDNTEGIDGNEPQVVLMFSKKNPFGRPGIDYSKSFPVTSVPLYSAPPEATAPAQDLSAAILALEYGGEYNDPTKQWAFDAGYQAALKAAAALASSANALSAGDRVDALDQISMIVDRDTPPDSRNEVIDHDIRGAPITRAMVERAGTWKRVRKPGQVSVGDKLRFTIGGKQQTKTAIKILHAGTNKEEVIYSTHKNFYFITSMVVDGTSTHKNVEFRASILQSQKGAE